MKKLLLFLLLPLFLISCPKEEIVPEDNEDYLVEGEIGPSGGTLASEEIALTVPDGTFDNIYDIKIKEEDTYSEDFGEYTISKVYRIEGVPVYYEGNLFLSVKAEGATEEGLYMAVGTVELFLETEEEASVYGIFDARDSSGYIVAEISPFEGSLDESGLKSAENRGISPVGFLLVHCLYRIKSYDINYFTFSYPAITDEQKLIQFGSYLDQAMLEYFNMGMFLKEGLDAAVKLYGKPRIIIHEKQDPVMNGWIMTMPELGPVEKNADPLSRAYRYLYILKGRINISRQSLEAATEVILKSAAYIWAYRLLYYLYCGDRMDWYAFSTATYMKDKYGGDKVNIANNFSSVGMSPFYGMEAGNQQYEGEYLIKTYIGGSINLRDYRHAAGMYPFIKYLDEQFGQDPQIFGKIIGEMITSESQTPMEGIINALPVPEYEWWPGFFKAYLNRELADIPADAFLGTLKNMDQIDFFYEKDTSRYNDYDFEDLSAKLYQVNFLFPGFEKEARLHLKLGPSHLNLDYVTVIAFGLKDGVMHYLDQAQDLIIPDLKSYQEAGYTSFPVVVVNSANEPSQPETMNIELETSLVTAPQDFNYVLVNDMQARSVYTDNYAATYEGEVLMLDGKPHKGVITGNTFTATWSEPLGSGTSAGTIIIEFDPEQYPRRIVSYSITETITFSDTRTYTFWGDNIDFWGFEDSHTIPTFKYWASGSEVCNYLTYAYEEYMSSDGNYSYSTDGSVICNTDSDISFELYYLEE